MEATGNLSFSTSHGRAAGPRAPPLPSTTADQLLPPGPAEQTSTSALSSSLPAHIPSSGPLDLLSLPLSAQANLLQQCSRPSLAALRSTCAHLKHMVDSHVTAVHVTAAALYQELLPSVLADTAAAEALLTYLHELAPWALPRGAKPPPHLIKQQEAETPKQQPQQQQQYYFQLQTSSPLPCVEELVVQWLTEAQLGALRMRLQPLDRQLPPELFAAVRDRFPRLRRLVLRHVVLRDDDPDTHLSGGLGVYGPYGSEDDDDEYPVYDSYDDSHDYDNYDDDYPHLADYGYDDDYDDEYGNGPPPYVALVGAGAGAPGVGGQEGAAAAAAPEAAAAAGHEEEAGAGRLEDSGEVEEEQEEGTEDGDPDGSGLSDGGREEAVVEDSGDAGGSGAAAAAAACGDVDLCGGGEAHSAAAQGGGGGGDGSGSGGGDEDGGSEGGHEAASPSTSDGNAVAAHPAGPSPLSGNRYLLDLSGIDSLTLEGMGAGPGTTTTNCSSSFNRFPGMLAASLACGAASLTHLSLCGMALGQETWGLLAGLTALRRLELRSCVATDPQLSCLTALTHLTSLTLGSLLVYKSQQQQQQAEQAGADAGSEDEEQQEQLLLLPLGQLPHLQQLDVALCDHREPGVVPMDSWVREGLAELQGLTSLRYDLLPPRVMMMGQPRRETDLDPRLLSARLPHLVVLHLPGQQLGPELWESLAGLEQLRELQVRWIAWGFRNSTAQSLKPKTSLRVFAMAGPDISLDICSRSVHSLMPYLEDLRIAAGAMAWSGLNAGRLMDISPEVSPLFGLPPPASLAALNGDGTTLYDNRVGAEGVVPAGQRVGQPASQWQRPPAAAVPGMLAERWRRGYDHPGRGRLFDSGSGEDEEEDAVGAPAAEWEGPKPLLRHLTLPHGWLRPSLPYNYPGLTSLVVLQPHRRRKDELTPSEEVVEREAKVRTDWLEGRPMGRSNVSDIANRHNRQQQPQPQLAQRPWSHLTHLELPRDLDVRMMYDSCRTVTHLTLNSTHGEALLSLMATPSVLPALEVLTLAGHLWTPLGMTASSYYRELLPLLAARGVVQLRLAGDTWLPAEWWRAYQGPGGEVPPRGWVRTRVVLTDAAYRGYPH